MDTIGTFYSKTGEMRKVNFGVCGFKTLICKDGKKFMAWFNPKEAGTGKGKYETIVCRESFKNMWIEVYRIEDALLEEGVKKFFEEYKKGGVV